LEASSTRGFDVNRAPSLSVAGAGASAEEDEEQDEAAAAAAAAAASSSPNNSAGSFPMDFSSAQQGQAAPGGGGDRACSRASDDDDGGSARKKLRLSKEQSAFLEESFKEHATLNPVSNRSRRKSSSLVSSAGLDPDVRWCVRSVARRSRSWRWRSSSTSGRARWRCGSRTAEPGAQRTRLHPRSLFF
jgi:hypothetical protein